MRDAKEILMKTEKKVQVAAGKKKTFIVQLLGLDGDFASWGVSAGPKEFALSVITQLLLCPEFVTLLPPKQRVSSLDLPGCPAFTQVCL